jgi:hypothetical protein
MQEHREILHVDDFFPNPDRVRQCALEQEYREPNDAEAWVGLRTEHFAGTIDGVDIEDYILGRLYDIYPKLPQLELIWMFHLSPEDVPRKNPDVDYDIENIHKDNTKVQFAGVIYLTPEPDEDGGTSFFDDDGKKIGEAKNAYNRLIFYPADVLHSPTKPFGLGKDKARMTLTFFANIKR